MDGKSVRKYKGSLSNHKSPIFEYASVFKLEQNRALAWRPKENTGRYASWLSLTSVLNEIAILPKMAWKAKIVSIVLVAIMILGIFLIINLLDMVISNPYISILHEDQSKAYPEFQTVHHMIDFTVQYYEKTEPNCFIIGSTASLSFNTTCTCLPGWHGPSCDIPGEVLRSVLNLNRTIERRQQRPRRIIFVLPINDTLQQTLKTMTYLQDVVDVFVYGNLFNANSTQNQLFQDQSKPEFGQKTLFVWDLGDSDPSNRALSKPFRNLVLRAFFRLSEVRLDDLVVFSSHRQLPNRNTLLFLKLHDNYPEEIVLNYPKGPHSSHYIPVDVCTVASLILCCHFDISKLSTVEPVDLTRNLSSRWVMLQPEI